MPSHFDSNGKEVKRSLHFTYILSKLSSDTFFNLTVIIKTADTNLCMSKTQECLWHVIQRCSKICTLKECTSIHLL